MWRPEGWQNPYPESRKADWKHIEAASSPIPTYPYDSFEASGDAMLKALREKGKKGDFPEGECEQDGIKGIMVFIPSEPL